MIDSTPASPLIVDPDSAFLKVLADEDLKAQSVLFLADQGKDAQAILASADKKLQAIFINPKIKNPSWIEVVKTVHQFRPAIPIYLIYDDSIPTSSAELELMGIRKTFQKPMTYAQIFQALAPLNSHFSADLALSEAQKNQDPIDQELSAKDDDFSAIRAADFISGTISYFDVYVRIQNDKYIKILKGGDGFSAERLKSYLSKGVTSFYIRKEAQKLYIDYCDQIASSLIKSGKVSKDIKIQHTLNHGDETLHYFEKNGVDAQNIKLAVNFVHNTQDLMKKLELDKQSVIQDLVKDVSAYSHAVGVSMIAALLLKPLNITSLDPVESVGIASLLHDIGLRHIKPIIDEEDESKMTDEQKKVYPTHPIVGADILAKVGRIRPIVIQAVEQHHERRNKKGFPHGVGAGGISIVAEIIGISDEYLRIIKRHQENPNLNINFELEKNIYHSFPQNLIAEFKKAFIPAPIESNE